MGTFPGEALLIKLWETLIDKNITGLLKPWQTRRVGRATTDVQTDAIIRIAQAERVAEAIKNGTATLEGTSTLKLTHIPKPGFNHDMPDLSIIRNMEARQIADAIRKEVNIAKAILHAEETLAHQQPTLITSSPSTDWLYRWRNCASEVSNEQMQSLWGNLLAGEIKEPGSFSLRTLNFLSNTTQSEAEQIAQLVPFVLSDRIMNLNNELLTSFGLTFDFLLKMQELGILSNPETLGLETTFTSLNTDSYLYQLNSHNKALIVKNDNPSKELRLNCCLLTATGREIIKLCSIKSNEDYLHAVGRRIINHGFKVYIASHIKLSTGETNYTEEQEITL